jgi:hypothetical protein
MNLRVYVPVQEEVRFEQREVLWEEVVSHTVEYEYEVLGNERRLVGLRNVGQTASLTVTMLFYSLPCTVRSNLFDF